MKRYMFSASSTLYTFCEKHPPRPPRDETVELIDNMGTVCGACEHALLKGGTRIDEPTTYRDVDEVDCQRLAEAVIKDAKVNVDRNDRLYGESTRKWIADAVDHGSDLWHDILDITPAMFAESDNLHISCRDIYKWEGQSKTLSEWAKHYKISMLAICNRVERHLLNKTNYPYKRIFGPSRNDVKWYTYKGERKTSTQWAEHLGLTKQGFLHRVKKYEEGSCSAQAVFGFKKDSLGREE